MSDTSNNFASRDVCDLVFYDYATQKPVLYMDYANTTGLDLSGESVFAYGGHGHVKRVGFNGDRGGQLKFETQITTMGLYNLVTGGTLSTSGKYAKREELTASSGLTLTETPVDSTVFVYAEDDDCGTAITGTSVNNKTVTATGITDGDKYIVYYIANKAEGVHAISLKGTSFPKEVAIHGSTSSRTEDGADHAFHLVAYKALPQSTASISWSNNGDPSTFSITFDLEADGDKNLLDMIQED